MTTNQQYWRPSSWRRGVTEQLTHIRRLLEKIMAEVQADQSVFDNAAAAIEQLVAADTALATAVNTFLANPVVQQLPDADVAALNTAVSDAATAQQAATDAQTALTNASTPPAPTP